jgi:hypothetical protein
MESFDHLGASKSREPAMKLLMACFGNGSSNSPHRRTRHLQLERLLGRHMLAADFAELGLVDDGLRGEVLDCIPVQVDQQALLAESAAIGSQVTEESDPDPFFTELQADFPKLDVRAMEDTIAVLAAELDGKIGEAALVESDSRNNS